MKLLKKISLFTLIFTMLFGVTVFAEETTTPTEGPSILDIEDVPEWALPPQDVLDSTNAPGFSIGTMLGTEELDFSHTLCFNILDYEVPEGTAAYDSFITFKTKLAENVQTFRLTLVNGAGETIQMVMKPDMEYHNAINFDYGTYAISKFEWTPNTEFEELSMDYIHTKTFTYDMNNNEISIDVDLAKVYYENCNETTTWANKTKSAAKDFFEYAFESVNAPSEETTTEAVEETTTAEKEPTVSEKETKPSEEQTSEADKENETTASNEDDNGGNTFLEWLKNNIFTLIILVVAIVGFAIFTIKKNKK